MKEIKEMKEAILVIDPYISSEYLVRRLKSLGYSIICLQTVTEKPNDYLGFEPQLFDQYLSSLGSIDQDISAIESLKSEYHIIHGIPGLTATLPYAEKILGYLFPHASNNANTALWRSNKYEMNERLNQEGINAIDQLLISSQWSINKQCSMAYQFFDDHQASIVIKPNTGSVGSFGVISPADKSHIKKHFSNNNGYIFLQTDYLLQEKITGTEFFIDTVSYQGEHYITAIGKYKKKYDDGLFQYDYCDIIDKESDTGQEIRTYIIDCLNTLQMLNGLSHIEVYNTEKGQYLIEINTRTSGAHGYINIMAKRRYQLDQFDVYSHLIKGETFKSNHQAIYQRLYMIKRLNKSAYNHIDLTSIQSLHSYQSSEILCEKQIHDCNGEGDLFDVKAFIYLENTCQETLEADTKTLQDIELTGACFK